MCLELIYVVTSAFIFRPYSSLEIVIPQIHMESTQDSTTRIHSILAKMLKGRVFSCKRFVSCVDIFNGRTAFLRSSQLMETLERGRNSSCWGEKRSCEKTNKKLGKKGDSALPHHNDSRSTKATKYHYHYRYQVLGKYQPSVLNI